MSRVGLKTQQQCCCLGVGKVPLYLGRWEREEKKVFLGQCDFKKVIFLRLPKTLKH